MITIEDRLRDAYRAAADTVRPQTIRPLEQHEMTVLGREHVSGWLSLRRAMIPLSAAAAVALVAALTVVVPHLVNRAANDATRLGTASPAGRFLVAVADPDRTTLTVRKISAAANVAAIPAPESGMVFSGLATGDGRHYVAALSRPGHCRTWLYSFRLSDSGAPGRLTHYALPSIAQVVGRIAVSGNNSTLAYTGQRCSGHAADLGVFSLRSSRSTQWSLPGRSAAGSLSLTRDGTKLAYTISAGSAAYVLATGSRGGAAVAHSVLVAAASGFGAYDEIGSATITPTGRLVYFTTSAGLVAGGRWELRAADLATGRLRLVGRYTGIPGALAVDRSAGRIIVAIEFQRTVSAYSPAPVQTPVSSPYTSALATPAPTPSLALELAASRTAAPVASPSRPNDRTPVASPTAAPSGTPLPTPSASPSGQPLPSPSASPIGTPVPSPSGSPIRTPVPSGSASSVPLGSHSPTPIASPSPPVSQHTQARLALIDLATGSIRFLPWPGLPGGLAIYAW